MSFITSFNIISRADRDGYEAVIQFAAIGNHGPEIWRTVVDVRRVVNDFVQSHTVATTGHGDIEIAINYYEGYLTALKVDTGQFATFHSDGYIARVNANTGVRAATPLATDIWGSYRETTARGIVIGDYGVVAGTTITVQNDPPLIRAFKKRPKIKRNLPPWF